MSDEEPKKTIHTKLVGVTFKDRQKNIPLCQAGFRLFWEHEKDNPYDKNAILVFADPQKTKELGHLNAKLAADFVEAYTFGMRPEIICQQVTGGDGNKSYGLNVRIDLYEA